MCERQPQVPTAAGEATEIKIPVRPKKPDPIQITNVTKDSYLIKAVDGRFRL